MADPKFKFENGTQRCRYTSGDRVGQFVSRTAVQGLVEARILQEETRVDRITANLLNGGLSLPQWEKSMAERIKTLHIQSYVLGKGGALQYNRKLDNAVLTPIIEAQYRYLRRFSEAIQAGNLTEAQIRQRAKQYAGAAWSSRETGQFMAHRQNGFAFEQNILDRAADNCIDCEYQSFRGVVPIGVISQSSPIGSRQCGGSCRCSMKYFKERPEVVKNQALCYNPINSIRLAKCRNLTILKQ
jgi:hypothetical protein